ncbi:MAG TPA: TlpA family protein disulfide reductase [Calditrichaeota bacterium]|nr:TlpA family protein disulfide reductase [Calditrichota bacterium]
MVIKKYVFAVLLVIVLDTSGYAQIGVGDSIIPFNLPDTAGHSISSDDFAGQILLLNFFATWCGPCKIEAPQLEDSIWQVYMDRGVTVLGLDFQERTEKL